MKMHRNKLRVFVSSTSEDLKDYRAVARLEILNMHWDPEMMEHFGTSAYPTFDACRKKLGDADLVVLLVAFRRGWVPTKEQGGNGKDSITALEIEYARKHDIPVLVFLASETWPRNLCDTKQEAVDWVEKFREKINRPAVFFDHEVPAKEETESMPAFRATMKQELVRFQKDLIDQQRATVSVVEDKDYSEDAREDLVEGKSIPFLGPAVYGDGALSTAALVGALRGSMDDEFLCLATAAEYRQRRDERAKFLKRLQASIEQQTIQASVPAVYELLTQIQAPRLIVSAVYDHVLENRLSQAGKSFIVIAHIVDSFQHEDDGKIIVFHRDGKPEICLADKIDLKEADIVVYKPLGSPLLNDQLGADWGIDTVVITESDHLTFLGRLQNQHTQIPTAFSRLFQSRSLLFLGYTMDVWHFRLVSQVFQLLGVRARNAETLAVRQPTSKLEKLAWQRLNAKLIPREPNEFANWISSNLERRDKSAP